MNLSPFRRKELAAFVQDLANCDLSAVSATPADVPRLCEDLAALLRSSETPAAVATAPQFHFASGEVDPFHFSPSDRRFEVCESAAEAVTPSPDKSAPSLALRVDMARAPLLAERLLELSRAAAAGDRSAFSMRVPAEPDRDADLVLQEAGLLIQKLYCVAGESGRQKVQAWDATWSLMKALYGHDIPAGGESAMEGTLRTIRELHSERDRLHALVNNPLTEDFLHAVRAEVGHQVQRWGTAHDRAKSPADWFWLVGYLAGKALHAHAAGDEAKALHHSISTAAVLANWHAHILTRGGAFTPGHSDLQAFLESTFGDAVSGLT